MRIWSILSIKSDLKWCIHLSRSLFFEFQLLGECHCWWTKESLIAHVANSTVDFGWFVAFGEHQNFPCLKLIESVTLLVFTPSLLASACIYALLGHQFSTIFNYFVWLRITDEGSVPEMRIWSILLIKSDLKWCIHLSRSLFFEFQLLGECHCWWTQESPRAHVPKFYSRLRLICSVWRALKFSVFEIDRNCNSVGFHTIPFGFSLYLGTFGASIFNLFYYYFVWLRITDEGSVPEMRIWSILLIKSDLKWCIHLSRSLFFLI